MSGSNQDRSMEWEWMEMEDSSPVEEFPYKLFPATWSPRSPGAIDFYNYNSQVQFEIPENNSTTNSRIFLAEFREDKESTATTLSREPFAKICLLNEYISFAILSGGGLYASADARRDIYKLLLQRISACGAFFVRPRDIKISSTVLEIFGQLSSDLFRGKFIIQTECSSLNQTSSKVITVVDKHHKKTVRSPDEGGIPYISSTKHAPIEDGFPERIYLDQASSSQSLGTFTVADKQHRNRKRSEEQADIPSATFISDLNVLVPYSGSTQQSMFADGLMGNFLNREINASKLDYFYCYLFVILVVGDTDWSSSYYTSLSQSFVANTLAYKQHKNIKRSPQGGIRPIEITSDVTVLTKQATIADGLPECSSLNQTSSHQSLVAITVADKQHKNIGRSPDEGEIQPIELISDVNVLEPSISSTKQVDIADYLPVDYTECSSINQTSSHQSLASIMVADKQHKNIERSPDEGEILPIELISDMNVLEPSMSSTKQVAIADYLPVDNTECSPLNQTSSHQSLVAITVADIQHKNTEGSPDESGIPPTQIISDVNVPVLVDNTECNYINQTSSNKSLVAITVANKQHKNIDRLLDEGGIPPTQLISDVNVPESNSLNQTKQVAIADYLRVNNTECSSLNQTSLNKSLVAITVADKQNKNIDRSLDDGGIPPTQLISDVNVPEHNSLNQTSSSLSLDTFTVADEQHKRKTGGRPRKLITDINVLLPYSGFTQQAAAEQLNIGISTLKRSCRILDIKEWSELKNRNVAAEAGTYNQPSLTTRPLKKSKMRNARPVIVKAKYKGDTTKVNLFSSSKKVDLDEQLARKLNIELGSFKIKRMDEENEEILVSTDSDFEDCIRDSESQGNKTIRLLVEQITI